MAAFWRVIQHGPGDSHWNMAVDEAIFRSFVAGRCPPTIRFYKWYSPSISLGRFQRAMESVDIDACEARRIPVVRRPTGGRAVLHGTDLTFSVVNNNSTRSVEQSYAELSSILVEALTEAGVPVRRFEENSDRTRMGKLSNCFQLHGSFEIALEGRKVFGCAQLRDKESILQQNSLMLKSPEPDNVNVLVGSCLPEETRCILDYATESAVIHAICRRIRQGLGVTMEMAGLDPEEEVAAGRLLECKYAADEWNLAGRRIVDTQIMSVLY